MNERIRELEKLATETVKCGLNGSYTTERFSRKKFAELLIRECSKRSAELGNPELGQGLLNHFGLNK